DDRRALQVMRDRRGDAAAAGAEIQDARRFEAGGVARQLKYVFNQSLGVGSRNQHRGGNLELEVEKVRPPRQIRDRLMLAGPLDERAIRRQFLLRQRPLVIGVKLEAWDAKDVSE